MIVFVGCILGFDADHLHMVILIPPKYSMIRRQSQSSHHLRKAFSWLSGVFWKENIVWSIGYFVNSVGVNEPVTENCFRHQGEKDSGQLRM
ncbi:transposase [Vibrio owensii]|uniref:transposase n=1 Tax=Vibrio owensii TaxID=696485 RepID=UPI0038738DCE